MSLENPADRILGLIKRRGPLRSADLAAVLGTTAEAARQHLMKLSDDGLVRGRRRETWRRPAGTPLAPDAGGARALPRYPRRAYRAADRCGALNARRGGTGTADMRAGGRDQTRLRSGAGRCHHPARPRGAAGTDPLARRLHGGMARRRRCVPAVREPLPDLRRRRCLPGLLSRGNRGVPRCTRLRCGRGPHRACAGGSAAMRLPHPGREGDRRCAGPT